MTLNLDLQLLRYSKPLIVRDYLTALLTTTPPQLLTSSLLDTVADGSVPACPSITIYLSIADSADAIHACLRFADSATVRKLALKCLGKWFRSDEKFMRFWEAAGGVEGFMDLMAQSSVVDVKKICRAIGRSGSAVGCPKRREEMTKLLVALAGIDYHGSDSAVGSGTGKDTGRPPNPDKRNIGAYMSIMPACSSVFAVWYFSYGDHMEDTLIEKLLHAHPLAFQEECRADSFSAEGTGEPLSTYRTLMRRSVDFAVECVTRLSLSDDVLARNAQDFVPAIAVPLLRQLQGRKASFELLHAAWRAVITCIRKLKKKNHDSADMEPLVERAIRFWGRFEGREGGAEAEAVLKESLVLSDYDDFRDLPKMLRAVDPQRRVTLMKMVTEYVKPDSVVLDNAGVAGRKIRELRKPWPLMTFFALPSPDAIDLLERLAGIPSEDTIKREWSGSYDATLFSGDPVYSKGDAQVLLAYLKAQSPDPAQRLSAEKIGAELFETWKAKAVRESNADERSSLVSKAMRCAVASGSFAVYKAALRWARRFNKDYNTVNTLYRHCLITDASVQLLSGIPQSQILHNQASSAALEAAIKTRVQEGNDILVYHSETAAMGIRDPSFQVYRWVPIRQLFGSVCEMRLFRCNELQDKHGLSDDQVWDAILKPTLDMLIDRETFAMARENSALGWAWPAGFLHGYAWTDKSGKKEKPSPIVERFVEELAERRDQLWVGYRTQSQPGVTTLEWPWPRGLPFQYLSCVDPIAGLDIPYLSKLAEKVVFMDEKTAGAELPADEGTKNAIREYVHSYRACLQYYVKSAPDEEEEEIRRAKAWDHALTHINPGRMDTTLEKLYWEGIFHSVDVGTRISCVERPARQDPTFPETDDPSTPAEWHPDPNPPAVPKGHTGKISARVGDLLVHIPTSEANCEGKFPVPIVSSPYLPPVPSYYELSQYEDRRTVRVRDPIVAAAVLSINARYGGDQSLLIRPFPSAEAALFPAAYLDQEFLDREMRGITTQIKALTACRSTVPTRLVEQLADSLLLRLEKDPTDSDAHLAMQRVVRMLSKSDRPQAASRAIRYIVTNRPEDSSWHRFLLGRRFLRSLPFASAKGLFEGIATGLLAKLEEQANRPKEGSEEEALAQKPLVKISTVKMIAQLLHEADFIDAHTATGILARLLRGCSHYDVWDAVVKGLRESFCKIHEAEGRLDEGTMRLLETVVVPRASSINERRPPREEDWLAGEAPPAASINERRPPREENWLAVEAPPAAYLLASYERYRSCPSLQASLVGFADDIRRCDIGADSPANLGPEFLERVIFPMIKRSIEENTRWTAHFLAHHELDAALPAECLPAVPVFPKILREMVNQSWERTRCLPGVMYETLHAYCATLIDPPPGLVEVNRRVKEDKELRGTDAAEHWEALWGYSAREAVDLGLLEASQLLANGLWGSEEKPRDLTYEGIRDNTLAAFEILMDKGEVEGCYKLLEGLCLSSTPYHAEYEGLRASWVKYAIPVLERAIALVEARRTRAWDADPHRSPRRLPDPLTIRTRYLLADGFEPCSPAADDGPDSLGGESEFDGVAVMAGDVRRVVDMVVGSGRPYHAYLYGRLPGERLYVETLEETLKGVVKGHEVTVCTVLAGDVGADSGEPIGLAGYVRLELVCKSVLEKFAAHKMPKDKAPAMRRLLKMWFGCGDAVVRDMVEMAMPMVGAFKKWMEEEEEAAE